MLRLLILLIFISTIFSQDKRESWLEYVIEDNSEELSETSSINKGSEFYFTIQIAVKKTFDEAMEVVKVLNTAEIDAYIQKNDTNSEFKYRVRYGNFSKRDDAFKLAENIKVKLGYNCWIDKNEL
jgi:cell division septation protein DedD